MVNREPLGQEIIQKYKEKMNGNTIQEYEKIREEKNMLFTINRLTDGPAFSCNNGKVQTKLIDTY